MIGVQVHNRSVSRTGRRRVTNNKLAGSFMAVVRLAFIQRYLRLLDSSDRT
jgi:hypothetical protein